MFNDIQIRTTDTIVVPGLSVAPLKTGNEQEPQ